MPNENQKNATEEMFKLLSQLSNLWNNRKSIIARQYNISINDIECLKLLLDRPKMGIKDLLKGTGLNASQLSRILDRLEDRGIIQRNIDQKDRRNFYITLTEQGTRFAKEIQEQLIEFYTQIWEEIPCEICGKTIIELRQILDVLGKKELKAVSFQVSANKDTGEIIDYSL